jgi:hypothetical protein
VVFGIASSKRTLPIRLPLLRLWLRAPARAFLFLDAPAPDADARDLPPGLALRVSADASRFPYKHPRGLPSAVRVARIAGELVSALKQQQQEEEVQWLVLADDDTAFVLPNLLHTLRRYDHREPWYLGARSESAAQNAWHGFAMAYGGGGIAVSWPLARRLARVVDSCVLRYPHLYGSDARIYACLAELGVELTHEPGFHQVIASFSDSPMCCCSVLRYGMFDTFDISSYYHKDDFFLCSLGQTGSGVRGLSQELSDQIGQPSS